MRRRAWIEGFSSAQMTRSPGCSSFPSHRPSYRSRTRSALARNSGSVGNTHERYCQGLIASSASQRAIVEADASQIPRSTTSRCSSAREKRESGTPCVCGSSQAIAFTWAISSGGKTARTTRPRPILEPRKPLVVEASSPASDDLRRRLQPPSDLHVRQALCGVEDHLRPLHDFVRQRVAGHAALKLGPLLAAQDDPVRAPSRHHRNRVTAISTAPFKHDRTSGCNLSRSCDAAGARHKRGHGDPQRQEPEEDESVTAVWGEEAVPRHGRTADEERERDGE